MRYSNHSHAAAVPQHPAESGAWDGEDARSSGRGRWRQFRLWRTRDREWRMGLCRIAGGDRGRDRTHHGRGGGGGEGECFAARQTDRAGAGGGVHGLLAHAASARSVRGYRFRKKARTDPRGAAAEAEKIGQQVFSAGCTLAFRKEDKYFKASSVGSSIQQLNLQTYGIVNSTAVDLTKGLSKNRVFQPPPVTFNLRVRRGDESGGERHAGARRSGGAPESAAGDGREEGSGAAAESSVADDSHESLRAFHRNSIARSGTKRITRARAS